MAMKSNGSEIEFAPRDETSLKGIPGRWQFLLSNPRSGTPAVALSGSRRPRDVSWI